VFNIQPLLSSYFVSHSSLALFFQRCCHEVECGLYYVFYVGWRSALTVSESKREREKENRHKKIKNLGFLSWVSLPSFLYSHFLLGWDSAFRFSILFSSSLFSSLSSPRSILFLAGVGGGPFHFLAWHYLWVFHGHFSPLLSFFLYSFFLFCLLGFLFTLTLFVSFRNACAHLHYFFLSFSSLLFLLHGWADFPSYSSPILFWLMDGWTDRWMD